MSQKNLTKDDVLDVLAEFYHGTIKPDLENLKKEILITRQEAKKDNKTLGNDLKNEIRWLKDDLTGLNTEFSNTLSRQEFNEIKSKVDRHHPTN